MTFVKLYHHKLGRSLQAVLGAACDECRRRKIKCNRQNPCESCGKSLRACSYTAVTRARGRKPRIHCRTETPDSSDPSATSNAPSDYGESMKTTSPVSAIPPPECFNSPVYIQQHETPDSNLDEDSPHSNSPPASDADPVAWESSNGDQEMYQSSSYFMLPRSTFAPYVRIFLQRLYPVFPVVDQEALLASLKPEKHGGQLMSMGMYGFLTALSAAVIVQLNIANLDEFERSPSTFAIDVDAEWTVNSQSPFSAQFFLAQCMQARHQRDFIEIPDEWTILTSFFLFAYHGNMDRSQSAWYYLREAIGFVQALRLDEEDAYLGLDRETEQRRKRLFWLILITERAYAIQHRRRPVLRPTIDLPRVFDSPDPRLAYGFVTLAKLFAAVDEAFITAWTDHPVLHGASISQQSIRSIARLLKHDDVAGVLSVAEIDETQRLDILVTQHWLRILACQLRKDVSPQATASQDGFPQSLHDDVKRNTDCVLNTSRSLLEIICSATPATLESHGIGMEQKISDVANCLCDILAELDMNEFYKPLMSAPECLHNLMLFLASFRNHESQYLPPLAQKASHMLAARVQSGIFSGDLRERSDTERTELLRTEDIIENVDASALGNILWSGTR